MEAVDCAGLIELFTSLSPDEAARMRAAAEGVEAVRSPGDSHCWQQWPGHLIKDPPGNGTQLSVLGTTLQLFNRGGDWLEFGLSVVREQQPRFTVSATIEVACWCEPDHHLHEVQSREWLVGTPAALTEAFESAAAALVSWVAGSHDPVVRRASAGLPNPRTA